MLPLPQHTAGGNEVRIIDTHLHLWDPRLLRYPWLQGIDLLDRPYLIEDYRRAAAPVDIEAMVFVEGVAGPGQFEAEVRFAETQACQDPRIRAIVAQADLAQGTAVAPVLDRLAATTPLLRGIRQNIEAQPDPDFCRRPAFIEGVRTLASRDLHFEICANHRHLPAVLEFASQVSQVRLMLDHCGKPDVRNRAMEPWRTHLRALAALPNVLCKVSGLMTEAHPAQWDEDDLRPYIDAAVEAFGFARLVIGSDWPVCLLAGTLQRWTSLLERHFESVAEFDLERLYRRNAMSFYRL